ncbi:ArsR/SmtB family transcription factor [Hyphomonas pacifica]|nr:helix-turn-helix domain-containing protein [Hyphomonas pacifica]KCZ50782.1 hypothetical protein HY2_02705 [Hyphomonas pacifica]
MTPTAALSSLAALAHECRLDVFRMLVKAGTEGLAAGQIAAALDCPASSLSFHLAQLTRAGLLEQKREGRSLIYSVSFDQFVALMGFLLEDCCQGRSEICAPLAEIARTAACCSETDAGSQQ